MQPCIATVWKAGAAEPSTVRLPLDRELALDRDLFEVNGTSISRATNAPKLISLSSRRVRLVVPAACVTGATVIQRLDFDGLQRRISAGQTGYPRVHAAELGHRSLVARASHSALALLRASCPDPACPDLLVALPEILRLEAEVELEINAPAIVIVGPGAVAIAPGITVFPDSRANLLDAAPRFCLPAFRAQNSLELEPAPHAGESDCTLLRIAGHDPAFVASDLPRVARAVLGRLGRRSWFVPALLDEREPRLCLLYQRRDGRHAAAVSGPDLGTWLAQLQGDGLPERPTPKSGLKAPAPAPTTRAPLLEVAQSNETPLAEPARLGSLETRHAKFGRALSHLQRAIDTNFSILLLGESGTGKEHLARELHAASTRSHARFYTINVAALPQSLVETELFGHAKGAFTGTHEARSGAFVAADGGTLLLDEIADAPVAVQVALLSVLETRCVRAVGSDRERRVDVRVIAATSRDLPQLMAEGRFRADLYHRLVDLCVTVPPLRERTLDIAGIARTLLHGVDDQLTLSNAALELLSGQVWPGNIRTLRSVLRRAALVAAGCGVVDVQHLAEVGIQAADSGSATPLHFSSDVREVGEELWRNHALPALWNSRYERRAAHRAALIYLAVQRGKHAFPAALKAQWQQLFGQRWSTTENQRGLKELLQRLGASLRDEVARGWVLQIVGAAT